MTTDDTPYLSAGIAWSKTLLLWRWFLSPTYLYLSLCPTIKGSSCLGYIMSGPDAKNTLLSWRVQGSNTQEFLVFSGVAAHTPCLCVHWASWPPTWYPWKRDDARGKEHMWKLVLPTTHPQLLLTPSLREDLCKLKPPSASTSISWNAGRRESRWLSREQGKGLRTKGSFGTELSKLCHSNSNTPYLRGHVKSPFGFLWLLDIGVFIIVLRLVQFCKGKNISKHKIM